MFDYGKIIARMGGSVSTGFSNSIVISLDLMEWLKSLWTTDGGI